MSDNAPHETDPYAPHLDQLTPCSDSIVPKIVGEAPLENDKRRNDCFSPLIAPLDLPPEADELRPGSVGEQPSPSVKDQAFDPFLSLAEDKREILVADLLPLCDEVRQRQRRRRPVDHANYCAVLASVIANALRAAYHPVSNAVHYSRTLSFYSGPSIYYPPFLRATTLNAVVDTLKDAGFLDTKDGIHEFVAAPDSDGPVRRRSTFKATERLIGWLDAYGITDRNLVRLDGAPTVILRNAKKDEIPYETTDPKTASMIEAVRTYNDFLAQFEISLDLSEAELERMYATPERTGKPRPPINFSDKALCRIFNNGRFDQGGRFCRGWWINVPRLYRGHLLIDGHPTVELDYSGCFLRMLYHLEHIEMPLDPYAIPIAKRLTDKQKLDWKTVRTAIKRLTNIYLNASPEKNITYFPLITCDLPWGLKRPEKIYELIRKLHGPIAHRFQTGYGIHLMRQESDICAGVLADGIRDGVPVLPVYDSFLVQERSADWLRQAMTENYETRLGFSPVVE